MFRSHLEIVKTLIDLQAKPRPLDDVEAKKFNAGNETIMLRVLDKHISDCLKAVPFTYLDEEVKKYDQEDKIQLIMHFKKLYEALEAAESTKTLHLTKKVGALSQYFQVQYFKALTKANIDANISNKLDINEKKEEKKTEEGRESKSSGKFLGKYLNEENLRSNIISNPHLKEHVNALLYLFSRIHHLDHYHGKVLTKKTYTAIIDCLEKIPNNEIKEAILDIGRVFNNVEMMEQRFRGPNYSKIVLNHFTQVLKNQRAVFAFIFSNRCEGTPDENIFTEIFRCADHISKISAKLGPKFTLDDLRTELETYDSNPVIRAAALARLSLFSNKELSGNEDKKDVRLIDEGDMLTFDEQDQDRFRRGTPS